MNSNTNSHQLKIGTILQSKYRIEKILGEGGFGITYLATDLSLDISVAIKEYFPVGFVTRDSSYSSSISFFSGKKKEIFISGKDKFIQEARVLGKLSHLEGIVSVRDYFQENNTAYIVMEYLSGITLKDYLVQAGGSLSIEHTLELLKPVFLSLVQVHGQGLIHRDISPDNIMIMDNNQVKLLDFGAARNVETSDAKSMSVLLKPGYAPEEQYRSKGIQGPWTDVYALCATIYKCITGELPQESLERLHQDELLPPSKKGVAISKETETALLHGLSVFKENRTSSANELYKELYQIDAYSTNIKNVKRNATKSFPVVLIVILITILLVIGCIFIVKTLKKDPIIGQKNMLAYSTSIGDSYDNIAYLRQRDGITIGTSSTRDISDMSVLLQDIQLGHLLLYSDGNTYIVFPNIGLIKFNSKTGTDLEYVIEYAIEDKFTIYKDIIYYIKSSNGYIYSVNTDGSKNTEIISSPVSCNNFTVLDGYLCYYTDFGQNGSGLYLYNTKTKESSIFANTSDIGDIISLTNNEEYIICTTHNRDIILVNVNENSIYTTSCVNVNPNFSICQTDDTYKRGFYYLSKDNKTIYYYDINGDTIESIYVSEDNIFLFDSCDEGLYFITEDGYYHYIINDNIIHLDNNLNYYDQTSLIN